MGALRPVLGLRLLVLCRQVARCTAPRYGHWTASGAVACPGCGGRSRSYAMNNPVTYTDPSGNKLKPVAESCCLPAEIVTNPALPHLTSLVKSLTVTNLECSSCVVVDPLAKAACRAGCDATFNGKSQSSIRQAYRKMCKRLKGTSCQALFNLRGHIARHGEEGAKIYLQLYDAICRGD